MPALAAMLVLALAADTVSLTPGMIITRSVVVRPAVYRLAPLAPDSVVVRIRGSNLTVDFGGATLMGTDPEAPPDRAAGIGILIEGGRNVTLRGARVRGYKVGVLARGVRGLRLLDNDVSHNWKPRLWSGMGHESLVDWLYYHHNEADEWLRYGAGVYLAGVSGGEVRGNVASQGMNGLLLVRSDGLRVWNNDFSFLSGLGIGLYRSSRNTIMHNRLDYCVRGYVHGVYRRGQDSAALLLYEQSSHNVVAYNSMTHSGDGVFLWAGQSTMETGAGGANDNLFFGNDVSHAVANGVEVTFSRNRIIGNLALESEYGVWGGYSWGSVIRANRFGGNGTGIAIEHGQDNRILDNVFDGDGTALRLWANPVQPADWGYPRHRDTRSRDYRIEGNRFQDHRVALRIAHTTGVRLARNAFTRVDTVLVASGDTSGFRAGAVAADSVAPLVPSAWRPDLRDRDAPRPLPGGREPWLPPDVPRGRSTILVDDWGPHDGRSPRLWPASVADSAYIGGPLRLAVRGPPGRWRVTDTRGVVSVSDREGRVGETVIVVPEDGPVTDWEVTLEYVGGQVVAPNGAVTAAGNPYRFTYRRFVAPVHWAVRVVAWDSTSDPRTVPEAFRARLEGPPLVTRRDPVLDYLWYRPRLPGFPAEQFGVLAEGVVDLPAGEYELVTISDDGIRVWADDRVVIDRWEPHGSELVTAALAGGRRRLRVEYYQVGGWVELRVEIRRAER
jgi:nitrous oxidase accessory protein NosD